MTKRKLNPVEQMADCIGEFKEILNECFETVIAPLGAGITIKPDIKNEDLAQRVFKILDKYKQPKRKY